MQIRISVARRRQSGIVLPLSLVILVMVTLMAIAAIRGVTTEERIAANLRNSAIGFEQAELALRLCEDIVWSNVNLTQVAFEVDPLATSVQGINWKNAANWSDARVQTPPDATRQQNTTAPSCMIERFRPVSVVEEVQRPRAASAAYTVTGRGYGDNSGNFRAIVQSQLRPSPL